MHKLAIVIPFYKIDYFENCLQSVASQTDKRFTLYIGNDASPDNPTSLINKYLNTDHYKYYQYSENLGSKNLALQWERILQNVTEEWFQILGDDDVISANFVEEFYAQFQDKQDIDSNVVKFSQRWIDHTGQPLNDYTTYPHYISPIENWTNKFIKKHRSSLSEYIFCTAVYKKHRFRQFPLAWGTDDFAVLEFSEDRKILFIDAANVQVRITDQSISGRNTDLAEKAFANYQFYGQILTKYLHRLPHDFVRAQIKRQIDYAYHHKTKLNISLFKIYLYLGEYKKALKTPATFFYLYFR